MTPTDIGAEHEVLTIEETARVLRIGRRHAYLMARRGEIPVVRLGKRLVVPRSALTRFLSSAEPTNPAA